MSHHSTAPPELQLLHHHLSEQLGLLRFAPPLETQFLSYLQTTQRRTVLFTLYATTVMWCIYTGLDGWRMHTLADTGHVSQIFWRSFVLRWPVLACLLCALYNLHTHPHARNRQEWSLVALLIAVSIAVPTSSYTLKNLNMLETSVSMVLLVSVALFPLGVRLRVMAPLAVWVSLAITLSGPLLLHMREEMLQHWVLSGVVWVTFLLSFVAAYYREKGLREQFLLRRMLDWEASHDPLTGLANRRKFQEHFQTVLRHAQRQNDPLHLVILDIDHFKLYNDHYGHSAGDAALREVAQLLQGLARRPLDLAVRLGGEEFGWVIYGLQPPDITTHLQALQTALAQLYIPHAASPTASCLSLSMGCAQAAGPDTVESVFRRADALLYQAKHQGRCQACVEVWTPNGTAVHTLSSRLQPTGVPHAAPETSARELEF